MIPRNFEFRRHSIKDGPTSATIGPKGEALARLVGERQLRGRKFTRFFESPVPRTGQTLRAFAEGAGDFLLPTTPEIPLLYVVRPEVKTLWEVCRAAELRGEDMMSAAIACDLMFVVSLSLELRKMFLDFAWSLPEGTSALIVGHSPHIEIMMYGLSGDLLPGLKECQGVRVTFGKALTVERCAADLDPSVLRAGLFP